MTQKKKPRKKLSMRGSLTVRIPNDLLSFYEAHAEQEGEGVSTIVRRALRDYAKTNGFTPVMTKPSASETRPNVLRGAKDSEHDQSYEERLLRERMSSEGDEYSDGEGD